MQKKASSHTKHRVSIALSTDLMSTPGVLDPAGAEKHYDTEQVNGAGSAHGSNRAPAHALRIQANNDAAAVSAWLARYADTQTTFSNYRKEAERLLLWSLHQRHKPLSSLTHEDLLAYQQFLQDPQPASAWVMPSGRKVGRNHPDWRPFAGPLSTASRRQALLVINGLFAWLVSAGYLAANPLALARKRSRLAPTQVSRYLNDIQWKALQQAAFATDNAPPQGGAAEKTARATDLKLRARNRWMLSILYGCGLRVSELVAAEMGDFISRVGPDGHERWWLLIHAGKGGKQRRVPITREVLGELRLYRIAMGLSALPVSGEPLPVLMPLSGKPRPITRAAVHAALKKIVAAAAQSLREQDPALESHARHLEQASAHWLRHTAGSHMVNNAMDIRHVRDTLGHASLSTTNTYLHAPDDERHDATENSHTLNWSQALP